MDLVLWPGGKMPPDTAGKDACLYGSGALHECPKSKTGNRNSLYLRRFRGILPFLNFSQSAQIYG